MRAWPGIWRVGHIGADTHALQAVRVVLALANGTLLELTPDSNLHLWRAGQVLLHLSACHFDKSSFSHPRLNAAQSHVSVSAPFV